jgi:hypothetical protein
MAEIKIKVCSLLIIVSMILTGILIATPTVMAGKVINHEDPTPSDNGYKRFIWEAAHPLEDDYIEWWYFKLTDPDTNRNFIFFYIIVNPKDTAGSKANTGAYVAPGMYYDEDTEDNGNGDKVFVIDKYDLSALFPAPQVGYLDVRIDYPNNYASTTDPPIPPSGGDGDIVHTVGNIRSTAEVKGMLDGLPFVLSDWSWDLTFTRNVGGQPDPNLWIPYMMDAEVTGSITVNGQTYNAESDWVGYQDHNWGYPFPRQWIWGGASFFTPGTNEEMSFILGGGNPGVEPFVNERGLSLALSDDEDYYEWSTSDGDIISYTYDNRYWYEETPNLWQIPNYCEVIVMDQTSDPERYRLEVSFYIREDITIRYPMPKPEGGEFNDFGSLGAQVSVKLSQWNGISLSWDEIKTWHPDNPSMNQLWGGFEYGVDSILPDLIIEDIWAPGSLPGPIMATVKNQGTHTANDFWVSFIQKKVSGMTSEPWVHILTQDIPLVPIYVGTTLNPGETKDVTTQWTSPPFQPNADEFHHNILWVYADRYDTLTDPPEIKKERTDRVVELDEENNHLAYNGDTGEILHTYEYGAFIPGDTIEIEFSVRNPAYVTSVVTLTIDESTVPTNWGTNLYDSFSNPVDEITLSPKESSTMILEISTPATATEGAVIDVSGDWVGVSDDTLYEFIVLPFLE